ncbi:MAG: acyl-CoA dehydrogenase family protein [Gammaproteobacteria bacterium]|nr:acyl-CoA dehydrogenase family protein [Gammaproteobacteria bacterium]
MDLSLSDEQQLLKVSVAKLGWLALPFAEEDGGLGGSAMDVAVLMEEFGRGLVAEPYLVNIAVCGAFLGAAEPAQREAFLPGLIAGVTQWAFAFAEPDGRYNLANISLTASAAGDGWLLNGEKIAVLNAGAADCLLVTARTAGDRCDSEGISLFLVAADAAGVTRTSYPLVDGSAGADVSFRDVQVEEGSLLGQLHGGLPLVEDVIAGAIIAMAGEAVGAMDALLEQTVAYTKTREQFGQPIGSFQVLQHRMVDMYLQCQATRSLLYYAAIARAEDRADTLQAASALKVKMGEAGRYVSQQAVQLHGGMGMTDELGIGHYLKRLLLLNTLFGDSEYHLEKYARF